MIDNFNKSYPYLRDIDKTIIRGKIRYKCSHLTYEKTENKELHLKSKKKIPRKSGEGKERHLVSKKKD